MEESIKILDRFETTLKENIIRSSNELVRDINVSFSKILNAVVLNSETLEAYATIGTNEIRRHIRKQQSIQEENVETIQSRFYFQPEVDDTPVQDSKNCRIKEDSRSRFYFQPEVDDTAVQDCKESIIKEESDGFVSTEKKTDLDKFFNLDKTISTSVLNTEEVIIRPRKSKKLGNQVNKSKGLGLKARSKKNTKNKDSDISNSETSIEPAGKIKSRKKNFYCSGCTKSFRDNFGLNRHERNKHGSRNKLSEEVDFVCTFEGCNESFKNKKVKLNHQRMHIIFKCSYCDYNSRRNYLIDEHVLKIHDEITGTEEMGVIKKEFKCPDPDCEFETARKDHLTRHTKRKHPEEGYPNGNVNCEIDVVS